MAAHGGPEVQETARLLLLMDRFFDCLNVRSFNEGIHTKKPDLLPYRFLDDPRFQAINHKILPCQRWLQLYHLAYILYKKLPAFIMTYLKDCTFFDPGTYNICVLTMIACRTKLRCHNKCYAVPRGRIPRLP